MTTHNQGVAPETIAAAMAYTKPWEGFNPTVEPDSVGIPTLGHGFALIIDDGTQWVIRSDLDKKLGAASITLSSDDKIKLAAIAKELNAGNKSEATRLTNAHAFPPITRAEAGTLLEVTITEEAETARGRMGPAAFDSLSLPRQAVVIDTAYQRSGGFRNIAGAFGAAVVSGDHEEAARVLRGISGGDRLRVDDNAAHFSIPHAPEVARALDGDGCDSFTSRHGIEVSELRRLTLTPELARAVQQAERAGQMGDVREAFAFGAFRDMAGRARDDDRIARGLDGALRRSLGLAFGRGGRPEVRALQAMHNDLPVVEHGRFAPLAVDGEAGPKTRAGFTRILETIGPDRMTRSMAERLRRY